VTVNSDRAGLLHRGVLRHADVGVLWAAYPVHFDTTLLAQVHACEPAYPLPSGDESIIPEMLPEQEPAEACNRLNDGRAASSRVSKVCLRLSRLPCDLLPRLLVRTALFAVSECSWRNGKLLQRGKDRAILR
jgi:hypothetical protein